MFRDYLNSQEHDGFSALEKLASNTYCFLGMHQVHYQSHNVQRAKAQNQTIHLLNILHYPVS